MYDVFNMGCGFVVVVPEAHADAAAALLGARHPGTRAIGRVVDAPGTVTVPPLGLRYR
jgi:phosphoribosylformylglycinamidine cyclo-ligase